MSQFQISSTGAYVNPQLANIIDELPLERKGSDPYRKFSLWGRLFSAPDRRASVISNTEVLPRAEFYRTNTNSRKLKRPDIEDLHSPHNLISQVTLLLINLLLHLFGKSSLLLKHRVKSTVHSFIEKHFKRI